MNEAKAERNCLNYEFCHNRPGPVELGPFCMTCGSAYNGKQWDKLTFIDSKEDCDVCFNHCDRKVMFPANCGHAFCIECSKAILLWDETRYHLDPVRYGCPPCPNACENLAKGKQCYCEEYDAIVDLWHEAHPDQFSLWNEAEHESIENSDDITYGKGVCPLCRRKYDPTTKLK
jgi:hypothetical protein